MNKEEEFKKAVRPLIKFLNDHYHPHATAIVNTMGAEVLSGEQCYRTEDFIKDKMTPDQRRAIGKD